MTLRCGSIPTFCMTTFATRAASRSRWRIP